jgi:hypothetical protein
MNRHRTHGPLDDVPEIVGDAGWQRVDMATDPALLPEQTLSVSENLRFDQAGTTVRKGLGRQFPAGTSPGTILHAGVFKPDRGDDQIALVTANTLVLFAPGTQTLTVCNFPAGETIGAADRIDTIQAGVGSGTLPTLYVLRGFGSDVLKYDAGTITTDATFQRSEFGLFVQDRIVANADTQSVGVSDFLDFGTWSVLNQFQILKGGDDYLVAFLPYQKDYVLIGTRKAWFIAFFDPTVGSGGYTGAIKDSSFLRQLTREAGPVGPRAVIEAMGYIWFITDGAIYAFMPQLDNELTVLGKPISAELEPLMARMSVKYARRACVARWGHRLYFALPISDEPVAVSDISIENYTTLGADLPFDLPTSLAAGSLATVTTAAPHGLVAGDSVLLSGVVTSGLNGENTVAAVLSATAFVIACDVTSVIVGSDAKAQKLARRNNRIAVYNLSTKGWESVDTLPSGLYADWLVTADYGSQRRLWVVDETYGPALYEEREADEVGDIVGGVSLPCDLPVELSEANFATAPIPGRLRTRALRWGAFPRRIKECEARATLPPGSEVTLNLLARTPNNRLWTGTRVFRSTDFKVADAPLRKLCGERALEAQVELLTTSGRPTFRSVALDTRAVGVNPQ